MFLSLLLCFNPIEVPVEVLKLAFSVSELIFKHNVFIPAVAVFAFQFSEGFFQILFLFFVCCKCQPEPALLDFFLEHDYCISESTGLEGGSCELF